MNMNDDKTVLLCIKCNAKMMIGLNTPFSTTPNGQICRPCFDKTNVISEFYCDTYSMIENHTKKSKQVEARKDLMWLAWLLMALGALLMILGIV